MKKHGSPVLRTSAKPAGARRNRSQVGRELASAKARQQARAERPFYDNDRRELRVGTVVVKCFTQRSDAQEIILASFQEENWCRCIDDPLSRKAGQDAKQRLRTAVANLNRRQRVLLLHFEVIRQGTGVAWRLLADSDSRATQERH